ncbi:MAG: PadR family transcriptional regulator [Acidobacteria bacterium]|nr:PadR family transcriptional regulator [Acidobacteriota bacterium]
MTGTHEILKGTLDLLVMRTLAIEPMHGWGIAERLREMSAAAFDVNDGSLYPALQRLKSRGWIRADWQRTPNNRRARYYELTGAGKSQLDIERARWRASVEAVDRVLDFSWDERA